MWIAPTTKQGTSRLYESSKFFKNPQYPYKFLGDSSFLLGLVDF